MFGETNESNNFPIVADQLIHFRDRFLSRLPLRLRLVARSGLRRPFACPHAARWRWQEAVSIVGHLSIQIPNKIQSEALRKPLFISLFPILFSHVIHKKDLIPRTRRADRLSLTPGLPRPPLRRTQLQSFPFPPSLFCLIYLFMRKCPPTI